MNEHDDVPLTPFSNKITEVGKRRGTDYRVARSRKQECRQEVCRSDVVSREKKKKRTITAATMPNLHHLREPTHSEGHRFPLEIEIAAATNKHKKETKE
jgi:hypothetical protein